MTILNFFVIIGIIGFVPLLIWGIKDDWEHVITQGILGFVFGTMILVCGIISCIQPFDLRKEMIRQNAERQNIIYQIEHLTEDKDKIKLNEWILTYNDWVNDVNAEKETWGWFAWHYNFDMSNHTIIELV